MERPIRHLRESFLYGRTFLGDADLNAQALDWLAVVANARVHGTTKVVPAVRFTTEEQGLLQALPPRPYRSLTLDPRTAPRPQHPTSGTSVPRVAVARRSLAAYAALAGGDV